jgi:hypothetical protein
LSLFKTARVEQGGYAVVWNEDIDLSEHHLWQLGWVLDGLIPFLIQKEDNTHIL